MKWLLDWIQENKSLFLGLVVGLAIAILFLTIGFWPTVLIIVCVWIGGYFGGHPEGRKKVCDFVKSWFHGGSGQRDKYENTEFSSVQTYDEPLKSAQSGDDEASSAKSESTNDVNVEGNYGEERNESAQSA